MNDININTIIQTTGEIIDLFGVLFVVIGIVVATIHAVQKIAMKKEGHAIYRSYRHGLARSVLIGLEFLVAGDMIRSVAGDVTLEGVVTLAIIVLIRLVLGMSLEMEIEGRWPWQRSKTSR